MTPGFTFRITHATTSDDLDVVRGLVAGYAKTLDVDLAFQGFAAELASLPGSYAPPRGALLLARAADGAPLGCVALRPMASPGLCEMKRLTVSRRSRGLGVGRALVARIVAVAGEIGYRAMVLDTLPTMIAALALYRQAGFKPVAAYYETPLPETVFLRLALTDEG